MEQIHINADKNRQTVQSDIGVSCAISVPVPTVHNLQEIKKKNKNT